MKHKVDIDKLKGYYKNIDKLNIAVIGDMMIDKYCYGEINRISPEAPVPVMNLQKISRKLGGAANVANIIHHFGASPIPVGVVGDDEEGDRFIEMCRDSGFDTGFIIKDKARPTTVKTRFVAQNQQIIRLDEEVISDITSELEETILSRIQSNIDRIDGIIFEDYNKGLLTKSLINRIIDIALEHDKFISVDPKKDNFTQFKNVNLFKPNLKELQGYVQDSIKSRQDIIAASHRLMEDIKSKILVVTLGSQGLMVFTKDEILSIPTFAEEVFDPTGAGDTMISILSMMLLAGASKEYAAISANHAAGIICRKLGTSTISQDELADAFRFEKTPHYEQVEIISKA